MEYVAGESAYTRRKPQGRYVGCAGTKPPPEMQCTAFRRCKRTFDGERVRCGKWKAKGHDVCPYHLKRNGYKGSSGQKERRRRSLDNFERRPSLPVAYSKYLSESLRERLESLTDKTPVEMLDLSEELKLAKATVHDAAEFYDISLLAGEVASTPDQKEAAVRAKLAAGQLMRNVIAEVGDIAGQAAGAMAAMKSFVGVQDISLLVNQIVHAVHDELGDDNIETVQRISERIKNIRMPNSGPQGTELTPDMDAAAMDATIPAIEHVEHEEAA